MGLDLLSRLSFRNESYLKMFSCSEGLEMFPEYARPVYMQLGQVTGHKIGVICILNHIEDIFEWLNGMTHKIERRVG